MQQHAEQIHALKLSIQNGSFRMVNSFPFVLFNEQLLCALQSNFSKQAIIQTFALCARSWLCAHARVLSSREMNLN